eukprot:2239311-Prymnesium_polylepis.2
MGKLAVEDGGEPLSSRHAVARLKGFGDGATAELQRIEEGVPPPNYASPRRGLFVSAAAAMLVALLEHCEVLEQQAAAAKDLYCPLETLIES